MSRKAFVLLHCVLCVVSWACTASGDGDAKDTQHMGAGMMPAAGATTGAGGSTPSQHAAGTGGASAGSKPGNSTSGGTMMAGAPSSSGSGGKSGAAGNPGTAGGAAGGMDTGPIDPSNFDYANQTVMLTETLTIAAGETVHVGPGTTFTAGMGMQVVINGTLIVDGTADAPVVFDATSTPHSWEGIVIASGGTLKMTHAKIDGATYAILAQTGSAYEVSYSEIGTSFKVAVLYADGTFDHIKFHASGDDTFSPVNEVSQDDVNGSMTIIDASPTVTHSSFDHSSSLVDMIRVGGSGSPVLDHVSITSAHCGLHTNGAANTMPTIKNSVLQGMSYGIMAYTSKPTFENCNFIDNAQDIGFCFDATADNSPTLTGNYYSSGSASYDASCFEIGKPDSAPAGAPIDGIGPIGL